MLKWNVKKKEKMNKILHQFLPGPKRPTNAANGCSPSVGGRGAYKHQFLYYLLI